MGGSIEKGVPIWQGPPRQLRSSPPPRSRLSPSPYRASGAQDLARRPPLALGLGPSLRPANRTRFRTRFRTGSWLLGAP